MNEQTSEDIQKIKISGEEPDSSEDGNTPQKKDDIIELPVEKMSKKDLLKKVEELQKKSGENYDKYLRSTAEIDNIIKRNKKEKEEWVKYSNEILIKELLQVIDNLEYALTHSKNGNSLDALIEGIELTLKGLRDTLEKAGLKYVKTEGESFDPCFHHAVSEENDENIESGKILRELQKGYTLHDRLIRPSMVVISRGKSEEGKSNKEAFDNKACKE